MRICPLAERGKRPGLIRPSPADFPAQAGSPQLHLKASYVASSVTQPMDFRAPVSNGPASHLVAAASGLSSLATL